MKRLALRGWFLLVLAVLTAATVAASLDRSVLVAAAELASDPWGLATLADAYFAFVAVWLWIVWRERGWGRRLGWLVAILLTGNFAIAVYFLLALARARRDDPLDSLFGTRPEVSR
ncbi:MAG: hypothetical protein AMXMBFR36_30480 [Acidobacteriota bacterium]